MAKKSKPETARRNVQTRDSSFTMRLSTDLKSAMAAAADDERRTIAQWLEGVLIDHLTKEGYLEE